MHLRWEFMEDDEVVVDFRHPEYIGAAQGEVDWEQWELRIIQQPQYMIGIVQVNYDADSLSDHVAHVFHSKVKATNLLCHRNVIHEFAVVISIRMPGEPHPVRSSGLVVRNANRS